MTVTESSALGDAYSPSSNSGNRPQFELAPVVDSWEWWWRWWWWVRSYSGSGGWCWPAFQTESSSHQKLLLSSRYFFKEIILACVVSWCFLESQEKCLRAAVCPVVKAFQCWISDLLKSSVILWAARPSKSYLNMNKQQTQLLELISLRGNLIYTHQTLHYMKGNSCRKMAERLQQLLLQPQSQLIQN